MKVRELIQNRNFDVNCDYEIYICDGDETWDCKDKPDATGFCGAIFEDECIDQYILNMEIRYITLSNGKIVIEVH